MDAKFQLTKKAHNKRLQWIKQFFNEAQVNRTVRSIDFFISFLSISNAEFDKVKKKIVKSEKPRLFKDVYNLKGKVQVGLTDDKFKASQNNSIFFSDYKELYNNLIKANDETNEP